MKVECIVVSDTRFGSGGFTLIELMLTLGLVAIVLSFGVPNMTQLIRSNQVINQTNSAWYPGYRQQPQQLQIATLRCIENRVPMARSVNGGISGFIDSTGRVRTLVEAGGQSQWVSGVAVDTPRLDDRRTLYGRLGEVPAGCLALLTALLLIWCKISPRKAAA